jgi:hypothetical protein
MNHIQFMYRTIVKRHFWNMTRCNSVGYIESCYKKGLIFQNDFITFRETSSHQANGKLYELSIGKLPHYDSSELQSILTRKIPVYVEMSDGVFGNPFRGKLLFPFYADKVLPLPYDVQHMKNVHRDP